MIARFVSSFETVMPRWISFASLIVLILVGTSPLWRVPMVFFSTPDGFPHLFRLYEFDRVIGQGILYPRWGPDLAQGFGYPLYNYYSPLVYYLTEACYMLGATTATALMLTFALTMVIGLTGAFALGCELARGQSQAQLAGLLTAVAYVFFPYFLLDIYSRGALPESLAAAVLPWFVWAWHRALTRRGLGAVILAGFFAAIFVLSHNLMAYMSAPLMGLYTIWILARSSSTDRVHALGRGALAILLGAMLTAFFWLPVLTELHLITGSQPSAQLTAILKNSFLAPTQVIQPSALYVYGDDPYPLALVPMLLCVVSLGLALIARRAQTNIAIFFGLATIIETIFLLPWTQEIWLRIPLLSTSQFAWRIEMLIGLSLAITVGALPKLIDETSDRLPRWVRRSSFQVAATVLFALMFIGTTFPGLNIKPMQNPQGELTLAQMARYEIDSGAFGFVWLNEYAPIGTPSNSKPITNNAAQVLLQGYSATRRVFTVSASQPTTIRLRTFYFPDWQAVIDDQPAQLYPSEPLGLTTIDVPAGDHRVELTMIDTTPRRVGEWSSVLGLLALVALIVRAGLQRDMDVPWVLTVCGLASVLIALPGIKILAAPSPQFQALHVDVLPHFDLIGLKIDDASFDSLQWRIPGTHDSVHLQVYWQVKDSVLPAPFEWRIVDGTGRLVTMRQSFTRYGTNNPAFLSNVIVEDQYDLPLLAIPAGTYTLQVASSDLELFRDVTTLKIENDHPPAPIPQIAHPAQAQVGDRIQFLGYDAPTRASPGKTFPATLYWRADRDVFEDYTVFAQLLDIDSNVLAVADGLTQDGFHPTMLWQPGTVIADSRPFAIPSDAKPGLYRLVAGMYRFADLQRLPVMTADGPSPEDAVTLGRVKIPMAVTTDPNYSVGATLGASIRMQGFDLQAKGIRDLASASREWQLSKSSDQTVTLKLYWQSLAQSDVEYKVFVHWMDAGGAIVAQQDHMPDENRYPTRIWETHERVLDPYTFSTTLLPPGNYRIVIGMYAPEAGTRLPVIDSNGAEIPSRQIELGQIHLSAGQ